MTQVTLSKVEMAQLVEVAKRFPEVEFFNIKQTNTSGIGATTQVSFALFTEDPDTVIDITDVSVW